MTRSGIRSRATILLALLSIAVVIQVFRASVAWQLMQWAESAPVIDTTPSTAGNGSPSLADTRLAMARQRHVVESYQLLHTLEFPVALAILVAFIAWFRYLDRSGRGLALTIAGFALPVVNLFLPFWWLRQLASATFGPARLKRALVELTWLAVLATVATNVWLMTVIDRRMTTTIVEISAASLSFAEKWQRMGPAFTEAGRAAGVASAVQIVAGLLCMALVHNLTQARIAGLLREEATVEQVSQ